MSEQLTLDNLKIALAEFEKQCQLRGIPAVITNPTIPVFFSCFALPEAVYIPTIGIMCRDQAALDRYLERVDVARKACE